METTNFDVPGLVLSVENVESEPGVMAQRVTYAMGLPTPVLEHVSGLTSRVEELESQAQASGSRADAAEAQAGESAKRVEEPELREDEARRGHGDHHAGAP